MVKNPPAMQETQVQSLGWKNPLEKGLAYPLQHSRPGVFYGERSLGYSPRGREESDTTKQVTLTFTSNTIPLELAKYFLPSVY